MSNDLLPDREKCRGLNLLPYLLLCDSKDHLPEGARCRGFDSPVVSLIVKEQRSPTREGQVQEVCNDLLPERDRCGVFANDLLPKGDGCRGFTISHLRGTGAGGSQ
jgi:hypothetical protein